LHPYLPPICEFGIGQEGAANSICASDNALVNPLRNAGPISLIGYNGKKGGGGKRHKIIQIK
jgi:hypothetical protein